MDGRGRDRRGTTEMGKWNGNIRNGWEGMEEEWKNRDRRERGIKKKKTNEKG